MLLAESIYITAEEQGARGEPPTIIHRPHLRIGIVERRGEERRDFILPRDGVRSDELRAKLPRVEPALITREPGETMQLLELQKIERRSI